MLKKKAFLKALLSLFSLFSPEEFRVFAEEPPVIQIEKMRFFDWEAGSESLETAKKTCSLQVTGFTPDRVFLSMQLSMIKSSPAASDKNALTIIKITATQVYEEDFSDAVSIPLSEAWLETSTVSTLGRLNKIMATAPHFIGGSPGAGLFDTLLQGIRKDGLIIGYRAEKDPLARVFDVGSPAPHLFEQLTTCLAKAAAVL